MRKKNENPNLKVCRSVGGWTHGTGGFSAASKDEASRKTFAQNSLQFIQQHGFDGIDIDWEYPGYADHPDMKCGGKGTVTSCADDVKNYPLLLKALKEYTTPTVCL